MTIFDCKSSFFLQSAYSVFQGSACTQVSTFCQLAIGGWGEPETKQSVDDISTHNHASKLMWVLNNMKGKIAIQQLLYSNIAK